MAPILPSHSRSPCRRSRSRDSRPRSAFALRSKTGGLMMFPPVAPRSAPKYRLGQASGAGRRALKDVDSIVPFETDDEEGGEE